MFLNHSLLLLLHLALSRETASATGSGHISPGMKAFEPGEQGQEGQETQEQRANLIQNAVGRADLSADVVSQDSGVGLWPHLLSLVTSLVSQAH